MNPANYSSLRLAELRALARKGDAEERVRLLRPPLNFAEKSFAAAVRECARLDTEADSSVGSNEHLRASRILQSAQEIYWDYVDQFTIAEEELLSAQTALEIAVDELLQHFEAIAYEAMPAQAC